MQDCSNSIANALELPQSCTKPSIWWFGTEQATSHYLKQWGPSSLRHIWPIYLKTRPLLVPIMVCCLFGTKPLSEPMLAYCQLDPGKKLQWNMDQNTKIFIQEDSLENVVCLIAAIFSWPQRVCSSHFGPKHWNRNVVIWQIFQSWQHLKLSFQNFSEWQDQFQGMLLTEHWAYIYIEYNMVAMEMM